MTRKTQLAEWIDTGYVTIVEDEDMCYRDYVLPNGILESRYAMCGIWFQGYRICGKTWCCLFQQGVNPTSKKVVHVEWWDCKMGFSTRRIRANLLTPRKVDKLLRSRGGLYTTRW
jgi:hypothetical protein